MSHVVTDTAALLAQIAELQAQLAAAGSAPLAKPKAARKPRKPKLVKLPELATVRVTFADGVTMHTNASHAFEDGTVDTSRAVAYAESVRRNNAAGYATESGSTLSGNWEWVNTEKGWRLRPVADVPTVTEVHVLTQAEQDALREEHRVWFRGAVPANAEIAAAASWSARVEATGNDAAAEAVHTEAAAEEVAETSVSCEGADNPLHVIRGDVDRTVSGRMEICSAALADTAYGRARADAVRNAITARGGSEQDAAAAMVRAIGDYEGGTMPPAGKARELVCAQVAAECGDTEGAAPMASKPESLGAAMVHHAAPTCPLYLEGYDGDANPDAAPEVSRYAAFAARHGMAALCVVGLLSILSGRYLRRMIEHAAERVAARSGIVSLDEVGIYIAASMTRPGKPGKAPRPVWEISGDTKGYADCIKAIGAKWWGGKWSTWNDPTAALVAEINANGGRRSFAERLDVIRERAAERADRLEERAERVTAEAGRRYRAAKSLASFIPMGQPILVGHHSEGRHRRDLRRIESGMRKSFELSGKADGLRRRAATAEQTAEGRTDLRYLANRLKEAETNLRDIERRLNGTSRKEPAGPMSDDRRAFLEKRKAEYAERAAYWRAQVDAAGGIPSKAQFSKGGTVQYGGQWYPVARVNRDTVTVSNWLGVASLTFRVPLARVSGYQAPAAMAA
ncbi:DUF3560 domain-containing protein [Azospirillum canadense]|uniref:DUF3560 domain-containing protein n=1 Tax=Azospirillum canadense TaxID=403962 RepID=UPI0022261C58|nr:DUF3560 domain-containing protein [Azospirillum canadense]MCW2242224.1 hypothetical protein [Azospirillum canadense]